MICHWLEVPLVHCSVGHKFYIANVLTVDTGWFLAFAEILWTTIWNGISNSNLYITTCMYFHTHDPICCVHLNNANGLAVRTRNYLDSLPDTHQQTMTCINWKFQAWDTLQDSLDHSSIDKVETSLEQQEHFSQFQDDWRTPVSHPSSCMLVNHGPSQQSCNFKEEYKPLKWDATARYYASYTNTTLSTRKSAKIQQAIRSHEDLLTTVKRCRLKWYGHVSSSAGLAKTILQGTVEGGRRQGRQKKRWEGNIREWTGLVFTMP